jgi:hypothetical protein
MGEAQTGSLRMSFDSRVKLEFQECAEYGARHGARVTSDAGLLAYRELDDALGLTAMAGEYLKDTRPGSNVQHRMIPSLRQSVYGRLAGYEDLNDAERLRVRSAARLLRMSQLGSAAAEQAACNQKECLTRYGACAMERVPEAGHMFHRNRRTETVEMPCAVRTDESGFEQS